MKHATIPIPCSILVLALTLSMAGCQTDNDDEKKEFVDVDMQDVLLKGSVRDIAGNPLSDVRVSTGALSVSSGADGSFVFRQAAVVDNRALIRFEKSGYFTLTRSGVKAGEMFVEAVLHPKGNSDISVQTRFDASQAVVLEVKAGMKVALSASSMVRADGVEHSGEVNADMLYLDPNHEDFAGLMPGGDLSAIRTDSSEVQLISYGMTDVNLADDAGNPLQLKSGSPAELTFPIPAGFEENPPDSIPLWSFDEQRGIWIEEGFATREGNTYRGTVAHFSWVNLDVPEERVTLKGKLRDCAGNPVPYTQVKAWQSSALSNSDGDYVLFVPANTPVTLSVTAYGATVSHNVPGQPGGSTFVQDFSLPCGTFIGEPGTMSYTDKGSIKYRKLLSDVEVITFDNDGKRVRTDRFVEGAKPGQLVGIGNKLPFPSICHDYMEGKWKTESPCGWGLDIFEEIDEFRIDEAELLPAYGYSKLPNRTIAGKSCNVYSVPLPESDGCKAISAVWNGLVLSVEIVCPNNTFEYFVALSATLDVPDSAFEPSTEITWLPPH